jgi:glycopeptide antibiotics resistance protein
VHQASYPASLDRYAGLTGPALRTPELYHAASAEAGIDEARGRRKGGVEALDGLLRDPLLVLGRAVVAVAILWTFVGLWRARRSGWRIAAARSTPEAILVIGLAAIYLLTVMPLVRYLPGSGPPLIPANFVPLAPLLADLFGPDADWMRVNFIANLVLYLPLGVGLAWRFGLRLQWVVVLGLLVTVIAETTQAFTPERQSDINDVLLNTLGTALGGVAGTWAARTFDGEAADRR